MYWNEHLYAARFLIFSNSKMIHTPVKMWPIPAIPEIEASIPG